ncbi:hypothetical protein AB0C42_31400, partial [Micromonospora taraxaci]|uniref:hypothetical protein n=1 Tax=Micromonospora taraxaci TaxID=1316803 RepID=UPI0033D0B654
MRAFPDRFPEVDGPQRFMQQLRASGTLGHIHVSYWLDSNTSVLTGSVAGTLGGVASLTVN